MLCSAMRYAARRSRCDRLCTKHRHTDCPTRYFDSATRSDQRGYRQARANLNVNASADFASDQRADGHRDRFAHDLKSGLHSLP